MWLRLSFRCRYLEALHAKQAATPDHTTLLLNCYTKLNDLPALDRFVRQPTVQFDADTAIRVCVATPPPPGPPAGNCQQGCANISFLLTSFVVENT